MEKGSTMIEEIQSIPHSVGCEKSVVSILMSYPHRADDAPHLTEDHFHMQPTRLFFRYIIAQIRGQGIDTTLLQQRMNEDGVFDRAGGASSLAEFYTYAPYDGNFQQYVKELDRFLAYRKTITAAERMKEAAFSLSESTEILTATSQPVTEIQDLLTGASGRSMSKGMIIEEALADYQAKCNGEKTPMGIETSLPDFNRAFHGLHKQKTIVISAYPGGGKTTLATQLCTDAALKGANVLICSLEMPQVDIMNRMLAYVGRVELDAIIDPLGYSMKKEGKNGVTKGALKTLQRATTLIHESNIEIEDMVGADVHQICAVVRRIHRRRPLDVVAVDYAQRIRPTPEKARESKEQQLSHASNLLADLSKELGFTLLFPSQLNKLGAAKHAEAINEDADIHCRILQNEDKDHTGILVEKNRGGESGQILPLVLNGPMIKFEESREKPNT
jgi:replicative DNA helicase